MSTIVNISLPAEDLEGTTAVVGAWLVQVGEQVEKNQPLLEIVTDKTSLEVPAPVSGTLKEICKESEDDLVGDEILGTIETSQSEVPASSTANSQNEPAATTTPQSRSAPANVNDTSAAEQLSPAVRRLLKKHHLDSTQIQGSGQGGRVTVADVEEFISNSESTESPEPEQTSSPAKGKIPSRLVPHTAMRKSIASHMVESLLKNSPHVTAVHELDFSALIAHRNLNKNIFAAKGVKLTFTAYFVIAAARAISAVPEINSRWHEDALEVFSDCNIAIITAVDAGGLLAPVLSQAQKMELETVARKLQDVTSRARGGNLSPQETHHSTFAITNHGVSGSLIATPAIHQPHVAILGIGKMEKRAVVVTGNSEHGEQDEIQIRPRAYVTITIDHRAIDGQQANAFMRHFIDTLENW